MSVLDLADCVDEFAVETVVVTRTTASQTVNSFGLIVPGATTTVNITALVMPAPGDMVDRLPEGQRTGGVIVIYSRSELQPADSDPSDASDRMRGDLVTWRGRTYEVSEVHHYDMHGKFYECIATEIRRG